MRKERLLIIAIGLILVFQPVSAQTWEAPKRLTWTPHWSVVPVIAMDTSDNMHIAYIDYPSSSAEIFYMKSTNGGSTWVTKRITWTSGWTSGPAIAMDSSDNIHIAWADDTPGNAEIFYKKSTNGGTSWKTQRLTWNSGWSSYMAITTDTSDNIHIAWADDTPGNFEIFYKKSTDGGSSWSTQRLTWTSGLSTGLAIAADSSNNIHIVWSDSSSNHYEIYYKKSTNGGSSWTTKKLTWSSGNSLNPAMTVDSNNHIHVVYEDETPGNYETFYKKSTNGGSTWTTKRLTWNSGMSSTHAISTDPSNNIYIAFSDKTPGNFEVYHMKSTNGGTSWAKKRLTWNTGDSLHPMIALDSSNNIHLVWDDETPGNGEIYYRKGIQ